MSESKSIKFIGSNAKWVHSEMIDAFKAHGDCEIVIRPWSDKRSLDANAQIYVWYAEIAKHQGETPQYVRNQCKLDYGLPIMLRDPILGPKISFFLNGKSFHKWPRGKQISAMELFSITSLFSTKQHNEYRDTIQNEMGKAGVILSYKT